MVLTKKFMFIFVKMSDSIISNVILCVSGVHHSRSCTTFQILLWLIFNFFVLNLMLLFPSRASLAI